MHDVSEVPWYQGNRVARVWKEWMHTAAAPQTYTAAPIPNDSRCRDHSTGKGSIGCFRVRLAGCLPTRIGARLSAALVELCQSGAQLFASAELALVGVISQLLTTQDQLSQGPTKVCFP